MRYFRVEREVFVNSDSRWRFVWIVLAVVSLMILWGWTQNGRYQFIDRGFVSYMLDTRTGELDLAYNKLTPEAKEDQDKSTR